MPAVAREHKLAGIAGHHVVKGFPSNDERRASMSRGKDTFLCARPGDHAASAAPDAS